MIALWISWVTVASGSPVYPGLIADEVPVPCTPPCTVCHQTQAGGTGTATRAFAEALVEAGLVGGADEDALLDALAAVDPADLEALGAGLDPNDGAPLCGQPTPVYGCFSHRPGPPAGLGVLALVALGLGRRQRIPASAA